MTKGERAAEKRRRKKFPLKRVLTADESYAYRISLGIYIPKKLSKQDLFPAYKKGGGER